MLIDKLFILDSFEVASLLPKLLILVQKLKTGVKLFLDSQIVFGLLNNFECQSCLLINFDIQAKIDFHQPPLQ